MTSSGTERSLRKNCGALYGRTSRRREHGGRKPREPQTGEEQRRGRDSRRHESEEGLNRTKLATSLLPGSARLAMIRWFS